MVFGKCKFINILPVSKINPLHQPNSVLNGEKKELGQK